MLRSRRTHWRLLTTWCGILAWSFLAGAQARQTPARPGTDAPASAKIWIGREAEIENYIRTAKILKLESLTTGVTHPRKATLEPGGPVQYLAWKVIPPGHYEGFWESDLSEVAGYELDKILALNMVPPSVERDYKGEHGAAIMWASPTKSFHDLGLKGAPDAPSKYAYEWARQIVRAKMFDNLINNIDPNLGNWLVDPAWNLILIDHTRAFTPGTKMIHEMTRIDTDLWTHMQALTEAELQQSLGKWLIHGEAKSMIERRDKMQQIIDGLVRAHGEAAVFMKAQ